MTAPTLATLLPVAPAASAPTPAAKPSAGFARSLDDALAGEAGTPEPGAEATPPEDDAPAAAPVAGGGEAGVGGTATDEAPVAVQVLDPAAWAFALAVAAAPAGPAAQTPTAAPDAVPAGAVPAAAVDLAAIAPATAVPADGVPALVPAVQAPGQTPAGPTPAPGATAAAAVPAATPAPAPVPVPATAEAPVLPPGVVVVPAPPGGESAAAPTATVGESAAPAVAGPTDLPVPAAAATGQEHAGADAQTGGERPAGTLTPVAAPAAAAPAGTVAAPPPTAAPTPPPAAVATQVAPVVAQLASGADGTHTMTLVLRPETLGTVEVRVTVSQGTVDLTLRHASEAGRAALLDALPDLRRDLESSGLNCSKLDVDRDSGSSWTSSQQQAAEQRAREAATGRERSWLRSPDADGGRPAPVVHSPSSGLDVRV
ncbi:flagellar hook-length control protein FliK [Blastococcus sp. TF02A-26]|uniref:flagellar hook-length control protein FliK n=1 Tax=Blastococcus sp. TF02A-26 TaxID=2250577 RepID=UPI000DE93A91|nr:flagellar hook-length control protein FliK [Blastococcus sp. TF02A-26]RBY86068.1 hypothetical protein DQ240_09615 [Blastococcus sp. TF02A-26]